MKITLKRVCLWALSCVLFANGVHADTRAHEKEELARFSRYAGDPIDQFPMFDLWQWQVVGPQNVVVWSKINEAYLIGVDKPCTNLEWAHGLSLTQEMRQKVTKKFDFVVFRDQRCKITEIRPIDYQAMLKSGDAKPADAARNPAANGTQGSGGT